MAGNKKLGDALDVDDLIGKNGGGRFARVPQGSPTRLGDRISSELDDTSDIQTKTGEPVPGRSDDEANGENDNGTANGSDDR